MGLTVWKMFLGLQPLTLLSETKFTHHQGETMEKYIRPQPGHTCGELHKNYKTRVFLPYVATQACFLVPPQLCQSKRKKKISELAVSETEGHQPAQLHEKANTHRDPIFIIQKHVNCFLKETQHP